MPGDRRELLMQRYAEWAQLRAHVHGGVERDDLVRLHGGWIVYRDDDGGLVPGLGCGDERVLGDERVRVSYGGVTGRG